MAALSALEVIAIFKLEDQATNVFRKIGEEARALAKELKEIALGIDKNFGMAFTAISTGISQQITDVGLLTKAWEGAAIAARTAGRAAHTIVGGAGGGGGGSSRNILGFRPSPLSVPGGHIHGSNAAMAGMGAIGYGAYLEAEIEDATAQAMYHLHKYDDETRKKIHENITGALGSGFSVKDISHSILDMARLFKGTPGGGMDIMPELLQSATTEARLKGTSLDEATKAFVGLAHMTKEYTPEEIRKLIPYFSFLSTAAPGSLGSMERAFSYAVPTLQSGLGMDPDQIMLAGVAMQRAGVTNTKSGTWLRSLAEYAARPVMEGKGKNIDQLVALGLADESGELLWKNAQGKLDLDRLLEIAGPRALAMRPEDRLATEEKVFKERGTGAFSILSDPKVLEQMNALKKEYPDFHADFENWKQYYGKESPVQLGRETWGDLQRILIDIGQNVLPPFVGALRTLDEVLKGLIAHMPAPGNLLGPPVAGSFGDAVGKGMGAGAVAGGLYGGLFGTPLFPGVGTIAGAAGGAAIGAGVGGAIGGGAWLYNYLSPDLIGKAKADEFSPSFNERFGNWDKQSLLVQPPKTEVQNFVSTVNIDGAQLARVVEQHIATNNEIADSASTGNGVASYHQNDWNP
jgi:hypothetical protein